jgi:hypothetical protein
MGDSIQFVRDKYNLNFGEALTFLGLERPKLQEPTALSEDREVARLQPPSEIWQQHGAELLRIYQEQLWSPTGERALAWLHQRGFTNETIHWAQLGYNSTDLYEERSQWGLPPTTNRRGKPQKIWVPRGIVIPWQINGELWRLNVRRPLSERQMAMGMAKYIGPAGSSNGLYNADAINWQRPVILLEGELDACIVQQWAGDLVTPVATGSTSGSRRIPWLARLALAPRVLVAYDNDTPGELASHFWIDALTNAVRWRPYWADANRMAQDGADVRAWILAGMEG